MGKIIHTKDGRTLMKGPDGRWMKYSGEKKAAEKNDSSKYQLQKVRPFDYKGARSEMAYLAPTKEQAIDTIKNAPFVVTDRSFEKSKDTNPNRFKKITDYEMKVHPKDGEFGTKAYAYSATLNDKEGTVLHFADISNDAAKALGYKKTEGKTHTRSGYIFKTAEEAQEAARKAAAWDVENDRSAGRFKSADKEKAPAKKSVPKNQIEVSDSHYIYSSGKRPSGNGNWAFYIGNSEEPIFFSGKYSEAKKKAIAEAAKRGVKKITLGS